ncbi:MAG: glycosyltransferase family 2 protein [Thermoanaerobaculia bacterium]|nr:glycosyltransferase family 2 protein [Thermoanaerobaculia bacterium]
MVTPSLNQGEFLQRCIDSVVAQDYEEVEHIVVDGGSTDDTIEILERNPHVVWTSEPDSGQAHAINKGFSRCRGELVCWLNCDDEYCPGAFDAVARAWRGCAEEALIAGRVEFDFEGRRLRTRGNKPRTYFRFLNPWIPFTNFAQQGAFLPRPLVERMGGVREDLVYVMDYELFCRVLRAGVRVVTLPDTVARHHIHRASKTGGGWPLTYPEWDAVVLRHASSLTGLRRLIFRTSFGLLRPVARRTMHALLGRVY